MRPYGSSGSSEGERVASSREPQHLVSFEPLRGRSRRRSRCTCGGEPSGSVSRQMRRRSASVEWGGNTDHCCHFLARVLIGHLSYR